MREDTVRQETGETRVRSGARNASGLARLSKVEDFAIADGEPDIRGWDVRTVDGWRLGAVEDLIVDTRAMRVRYMVVRLDKDLLIADADRCVFLPLGTARLDDDRDAVIVERVPIDGFAGLLRPSADLDDADEPAWRRAYGYGVRLPYTDPYDHALYDDRHFWGSRRQEGGDVPYIVRSPKGAERR